MFFDEQDGGFQKDAEEFCQDVIDDVSPPLFAEFQVTSCYFAIVSEGSILSEHGGFLSHGGIPSHRSFLDGIFHYKHL